MMLTLKKIAATSLLIFFSPAYSLAQDSAIVANGNSVVAHITDIEGKSRKWDDFLTDNPAVYRDGTGNLAIKPGAVFVFGGDAVDKGPNSMQIVSDLLYLKNHFPNQVVLIAGNRDINKIWLRSALSDDAMKRVPSYFASWLKKNGFTENSPENRLKWFLEQALGAPRGFEFRRTELAERRGLATRNVSDSDVVESFKRDVAPGGDMYEYLSKCQLIYRNGDTLYVHGAITAQNLFVVPDNPSRKVDDLERWMNDLNHWYEGQIAQWRMGVTPTDLMTYQGPLPGTRANSGSIVYARYSDSTGNSHLPSKETIRLLKKFGIHRIVVGHTPNGDSPTVLRTRGFEIIIADNAASPHGTKLIIDGDHVWVRAKTRLQQQWHEIDMRWNLDDDVILGHRVGRDQKIIKAVTTDHQVVGFKVEDGLEVRQVPIRAPRGKAARNRVACLLQSIASDAEDAQ